jgi:hypothetical protein
MKQIRNTPAKAMRIVVAVSSMGSLLAPTRLGAIGAICRNS